MCSYMAKQTKRSRSCPVLRASDVQVREIPASAHFLFYDNPVATFQEIAEFINTVGQSKKRPS